jgi:hypothetical protein
MTNHDDYPGGSPSEHPPVLAPAVVEDCVAASFERYLGLVDRVMIREHDRWVVEVTRRLHILGAGSGVAGMPTVVTAEWIEIESLSRLRSAVGGRFQNLRDRWVGAGFPLREHRGDKEASFTLNEAGWIELSNWISKQGFEARLTPDKVGCLFELRPVGAAGDGAKG